MQLPGIHGRDVIRVLRENAATKRMPIVAITASERATSDVIKGLSYAARSAARCNARRGSPYACCRDPQLPRVPDLPRSANLKFD